MSRTKANQVLKEWFGFDSFRPNQEAIVQQILQGRDGVVVMPTGGGKSLCYQLPAKMMEGACMVISPLISLMKDQVDAARAIGLNAAFLNSSLSGREQSAVARRLTENALDLIYISPERFAMEDFLMLLGRAKLSFTAIDEAHCISEWGHDFRPDYLKLSQLITHFPAMPVTAFTATATHRVQEDIIARLGLREPFLVRASFDRPNLFYRVVPKEDPAKQIANFVRRHKGEAGIVYRTSRKSVEATAKDLVRRGIRALPYHAGLSADARVKNQDAFNRDEVEVVVATIAFGMGIDKSNIRYVLHGDLPKNMESYYQETGRAGRDGEPAECLLLFGRGDIPKLRFFIDQIEHEQERMHALSCLNEMASYASVNVCRRRQVLQYFGEKYAEVSCGACDICTNEAERTDVTREAQIMLSAMVRTGERYGATHVVDVVTGANTERMRTTGHDQIKTYGAGKDHDKQFWRFLIDNLLAQGLVVQTDDQYPVLKLGVAAGDVLYRGVPFFVLRQKKGAGRRKRCSTDIVYNADLFEVLRAVRKELADEQNVPPFVIFSDRSLHEMACEMPLNEGHLLQISGVGATKLARFGAVFLSCIQQFRKEHPETLPGTVRTVAETQIRVPKKETGPDCLGG